MKRLIRIGIVALPCVALAADPQFIPNPIFKPKVGDLCRVGDFDKETKTWSDVVAAKDKASFIEYVNAFRDKATLDKLDADGSTTKIMAGTRVKFVSHKELAISKSSRTSARVRLDEGPNKDRLVWVEQRFLFHAVGASPLVGGTGDPRAATLLKSGLNLEKVGKKAGALAFYHEIVIDHNDSAEAMTAAERIKALGGKVPAPSETPAKPLFRLMISEPSEKDATTPRDSASKPMAPFLDKGTAGK